MNEKLVHTIFKAEGKVYEAVEINRQKGIISGYLLFPEYCKPNPHRTFKTADCMIKELH